MSFMVPTNHTNPPDNKIIFEQYFGERFSEVNPDLKRKYIDVYWTNYYVEKNYCNDDMSDLQNYLNSLDRSDKYFAVCQWDDGIRNDVEGLDILVYASGGVGDYAYPLNCMPHNTPPRRERDILASFVGSIAGRHKVREVMYEKLNGKIGIYVSESLGRESFLDILTRSAFALCPRGYGKTSFRICESLEVGVIPVYIYDDPWIPFGHKLDFEEYGVLCHIDEIDSLHSKLLSYNERDIRTLIQRGSEVYQEYYSYDGCYSRIIEDLRR